MDFVATLTEGVVLGLPWVLLGIPSAFLGWKWLKPRIVTSIFNEFLSFADDLRRYPEAYEDLTAPLVAGAQEIVTGSLSDVATSISKSPQLKEWASDVVGIAMSKLAADVQKNPDKYANLLKPVFQKAVKDFTSGGAGGVMPKMKLQDIIGMIAMRLLGNLANEAPKKALEVAAEANPFA